MMKHKVKNSLDSGFLYCRNNHKRIDISVEEYNSQIKYSLYEELSTMTSANLKKFVVDVLNKEKILHEKLINKMQSEKIDHSLKVVANFINENDSDIKSIEKVEKLEEELKNTKKRIIQLILVIRELREVSENLDLFKISFNEAELEYLSRLLIKQVIIGQEYIEVDYYLTNL